jgi:hypothetical protein
VLKKRYIPLFILSFLLTFNISVLADEGHDHEDKIKNDAENFRNGKTEISTEHPDAGQGGSHHDDGSNHDGEDHHGGEESSHGDGGNHQDGGSVHEDGSHEEEDSGHEEGSHDQGVSGHDDGESHDEGVSGHDDGSSHEEDSSHSDGGEHGEPGSHDEEVIVEPGPDYKVLGAFGTVNLAFLIIGIWNKWFRRKGE